MVDGEPRSTCHHAPAASVCVHEPPPQCVFAFPSIARSGSPPHPTVEELAAPHVRTPFIPDRPPPRALLVVVLHVPSATHGSNAHPPVPSPTVRSISAGCCPRNGTNPTGRKGCVHCPLAQSALSAHLLPSSHKMPTDLHVVPPQSTAVSTLSKRRLVQASVASSMRQTRALQSSFSW